MSAIRSDDYDGLVFTSDDGEEELVFVDTTAFFPNDTRNMGYEMTTEQARMCQNAYQYANILEPGPNTSKLPSGPLLVAFRVLVVEAFVGLLFLGWLIWNSRH